MRNAVLRWVVAGVLSLACQVVYSQVVDQADGSQRRTYERPVDNTPRRNINRDNGGAAVITEPRVSQGKTLMTQVRDDILWHAEGANVVYRKAGNVSLLSSSRLGLTDRVEISTYMVEDVIRPSIYLKSLWKIWDKKRFLASRFDVANAYPGMALGKRFDVTRVIGADDEIPLVFELGHELIYSRAWFSDMNCSDGSVYLILSAGLGVYGSYNFDNLKDDGAPDLQQVRFHFLANRGETLTGNGFRTRLKFWADGWIANRLALHGGTSLHIGTFSRHCTAEMQLEAEYFMRVFPKLSFKGGMLLSLGSYSNVKSKAAIWPIVDISYYFGRRRPKSASLFGRDMYRQSKF